MDEKKIEKYKNRCTVLISSCDKNEDLWYPFFKILRAQWPELYFSIVLNTETKEYKHKGMDIRTFSLYKGKKEPSWGKRLKDTLKRIDTEYIILILDDFFPIKRVDQGRIEKCIDWMDENSNISVFNFYRVKGGIRDGKYEHFEKRPQKGPYKLNCSAAIWRRRNLIKYIRNHESPWQMEIYGSIRAGRYKEDFYSAIEGEPYIYTYSLLEYGLVRGMWTPKIKELFEEYDVKMDYSLHGFFDERDPYNQNNNYSIRKHFPKDIFDKRFRNEVGRRVSEVWAKFRSLI